jgi:peptidoglycan/LPS O-acetylase OafA/YrhL
MLTGVVIGSVVAAIGLFQSFQRRHEPEPPNSRWKLPSLIVMTVIGVVFAVSGTWPVLWAALVVVLLAEIGFVLAGRNPWWMQGRLDRRREGRTSAR